jgi:outer membrane protein TolC
MSLSLAGLVAVTSAALAQASPPSPSAPASTAVAAEAGGAAAVRVDLATAKRYAVEHNFEVRARRHAVEEAEARRERAKAPFRPKLGVTGGAAAHANAGETEPDPFAYLVGSLNLYNGSRDLNGEHAAEAGVELARAELAAAEHLAAVDVEVYFHEFLYKKALLELKGRELARNDGHRQLVKRSRALGTITDTDVMEFEIVSASLASDLVALRQEVEDARSNLKRVLGEEIGGQIQPVGELQHQHVVGKLGDYLAKIPDSAAGVKRAVRELEIAQAELRVVRGRGLPQLGLETRVGLMPRDESLTADRPQASVVLTASMDLYTGMDATWERRESESKVARGDAEVRRAINDTIRDVEVAFRNLLVIEKRADLERSILDSANRYYDSVAGEYRRGVKNSADLKAASERATLAETRRVTLDYEAIKLRLAVERLIGGPVAVEVVPFESGKGAARSRGEGDGP